MLACGVAAGPGGVGGWGSAHSLPHVAHCAARCLQLRLANHPSLISLTSASQGMRTSCRVFFVAWDLCVAACRKLASFRVFYVWQADRAKRPSAGCTVQDKRQ